MIGEVYSGQPPEPPPGIPPHLRMSRQRFEQARHELMVELYKIRERHQFTHVEGLGLLAAVAAVHVGDYFNFVAEVTAAARQNAEAAATIALDGNVAEAAKVAAAKATAEAALRKG